MSETTMSETTMSVAAVGPQFGPRILPVGTRLRVLRPWPAAGIADLMTVDGGEVFWNQLLVDAGGCQRSVLGAYMTFHGPLDVERLAQVTGRRRWAVQRQLEAIAARVARGQRTRSLWRKLIPVQRFESADAPPIRGQKVCSE